MTLKIILNFLLLLLKRLKQFWILLFDFSFFNRKKFKNLSSFAKVGSILYTLVLTIALMATAVEVNFLWLFGKMPSIATVANPELDISSEIYAEDGRLIGKYYRENRSPVTFSELTPQVIQTLVVTEDVRFYEHNGIDFKALFSAVWSNLKGDKRGASTISQQLAKNLFKTRKNDSKGLLGYIPVINTLFAKSKEWISAIKLEIFYSKNQILTLYLNTVDFGANSFGIKVAAHTYFNKNLSQLNWNETSILMGMLKAPTTYNPISNPKNAFERKNTVLGLLLKHEKISQAEHSKWLKTPLNLNVNTQKDNEGIAPYFKSAAANWLKKWGKENGYDVYSDGLKIYTSINLEMQAYAEKAMEEKMRMLQQRFYRHWPDKNHRPWMAEPGTDTLSYILGIAKKSERYKALKAEKKNEEYILKILNTPIKMSVFTWNGERDTLLSPIDSIKHNITLLQAALMTLDPHTGQVKAWIGGINFDKFKFDHVSQSMRQPGSTFKPFVYATALEQGWGPCDKIIDQEVTIKYVENGENKTWTPHNADWISTGTEMTLRRGMAKSVNTVTSQLTEKVTPQAVADLAKKMGITSKLKPVPSIGLGSNEVTLFELTGAYGTYMNKGEWIEPHYIMRIEDKNGKTLYSAKPQKRQVLTPENAWLMTYMFRGGLEEPGGTSQALFEYGVTIRNEIGGKTGTSSDYSDGWFFGITKELVTGVWVGCDDRKIHFRTSQTGEGSRTALPIYGKYMDYMYEDPKMPISKGVFPQPTIPIIKPHNCRTYLPKSDSLNMDSLNIDAEFEGIF